VSGVGSTEPSEGAGFARPGAADSTGVGSTEPSEGAGFARPGAADSTGVGSTEPSEGAGFARPGAAECTGGEPPEELEQTVDPLAEAERQRDEYLDALQRLKAEFDNYRKRVARDQQELAARAHERLVAELVPVLDDLERAINHEGDIEEGVRLVHRALAAALAKEGLAEIATDGAFDPHTQEALLSQPSSEEEGTVIQVLQKGYTLGDRVLRPARVVISAGENA
jgi:molecular chaperone GrpE